LSVLICGPQGATDWCFAAFPERSVDLRAMPIPDVIPIRLMEDLHTEFVGRCADGTQFFLNEAFVFRGPFTENWAACRHEYLILYLFDGDGYYLEHRYWYGGTTATCDQGAIDAKRQEMLAALGKFKYRDIAVRPFSIQIDSITFGLIPNIDDESVELEPSSQISFTEPWDGEYDT
jgi:hypothetical protein